MSHHPNDQALYYTIWGLIAIVLFITSGCNKSGALELSDLPQVNIALPAHNTENVSVNTTISASFDRSMNPSSINNTTFSVARDTVTLAGHIAYEDSTVYFTPRESLGFNSLIDVTISKEVQDLAGNTMNSDFHWNFTTSEAAESASPQIAVTNPSSNAEGIPVTSAVIATFNKQMNSASINNATFLLEMEDLVISGNVNYSDSDAVFSPFNNLEPGTIYTATIKSGIQDIDGNTLTNDYVWSFTTRENENMDIEPPEIITTNPINNGSGISTEIFISASFSEAMNGTTLSTETFTLSTGSANVDGQVSYSGQTATFNPIEELVLNTTYTAVISTSAEDLAGNALASNYQWIFTTEEGPQNTDKSPPEVVETFPAKKAKKIPVDTPLTVLFSEPMDASTILLTTFTVMEKKGKTLVLGDINYSGNSATFTPHQPLKDKTDYTVTITTGVTDVAGNTLSENYKWDFQTEDD